MHLVLSAWGRNGLNCHDPRAFGAFLFFLEIHQRIHYWTRVHQGDSAKGFAEAHLAPSLLPSEISVYASECAKDLPYDDLSFLQVLAENMAVRGYEHQEAMNKTTMFWDPVFFISKLNLTCQHQFKQVLSIGQNYNWQTSDPHPTAIFLLAMEPYFRDIYWAKVNTAEEVNSRPTLLSPRMLSFCIQCVKCLTSKDRRMLFHQQLDCLETASPDQTSRIRFPANVPPIFSNLTSSKDEFTKVISIPIGHSKVALQNGVMGSTSCSQALFTTLRTESRPLANTGSPNPNASIYRLGHPENSQSSVWGWGSGKWRLTIKFSIFNITSKTLVLYDCHAMVYNRISDDAPPGNVSFGVAVELAKDNSILSKHAPVHITPSSSAMISLVLETSLFQTPFSTTIIFGLFCDCYLSVQSSDRKMRIPSDSLYIFQHLPVWGAQKCHFVHRGLDSLDDHVRRIYEQHIKLGIPLLSDGV